MSEKEEGKRKEKTGETVKLTFVIMAGTGSNKMRIVKEYAKSRVRQETNQYSPAVAA